MYNRLQYNLLSNSETAVFNILIIKFIFSEKNKFFSVGL